LIQYRNEREQSEPAGDYIAPARRRTVEIIIEANDAVWVCNRGNLSPPEQPTEPLQSEGL